MPYCDDGDGGGDGGGGVGCRNGCVWVTFLQFSFIYRMSTIHFVVTSKLFDGWLHFYLA